MKDSNNNINTGSKFSSSEIIEEFWAFKETIHFSANTNAWFYCTRLYHRLLHSNIDQTLVNSLHGLWNRWIRLSCYYNRV